MADVRTLQKQFLEYLEIERGRSAQTVRNYDFYLRRFFDWAKISQPAKITADIVRKYRLWLNRTVSGKEGDTLKKNTQNYHLIALRSFLKYLIARDIQTMPPDKIELAKQGSRSVAFLEEDELRRVLNAPLAQFKETDLKSGAVQITKLRDRAILELLFSTGLRVSELANLKIDNINLKRDEFTVRGKGDKTRVVFISDEAKDWLRKYISARADTSPYLFVSHDRAKRGREDSKHLTPRSIQRLVNQYAKEAGITKKITPHTMRHTFATDLLFSGADIRAVQELLGHSSITTTQVYTHVTNKQLKDVYKKFHGKQGK